MSQIVHVGLRHLGCDRSAVVYPRHSRTPSCMPPEQAEGRLDLIDERSEVCTLAAVLYDILTGEPPVDGPDMATV